LDGQNIIEILKGNQQDHGPIFTMKGATIRSVRKGPWKLFFGNPGFYQAPDLENWKDPRGPDGTTILAPPEQPTPAEYPGIIPEEMDGKVFLFNLEDDISEMSNRSDAHPEIVEALESAYDEFKASLKQE
jgi:hypothetical protein